MTEERMTPALEACPFCGGDPSLDFCSAVTPAQYSVHCQSADCPAWPNAQGDTEAEAIAAWNQRPAKPALEPVAAMEPVAWRPIETAPKDETVAILYFPQDVTDFAGLDYRYRLAKYRRCPALGRSLWHDQGTNHDSFEGPDLSGDDRASHWMPLPPPPGEAHRTSAHTEGYEAAVRDVLQSLALGLLANGETAHPDWLEGFEDARKQIEREFKP